MREVLRSGHIRAKRKCGVKRVLAFALVLTMFAGFVPVMQTEAEAADYSVYRSSVNQIDNSKLPGTKQMSRLNKKEDGSYYSVTGICNFCSMETLLNRAAAYYFGDYSNPFDDYDMFAALGVTDYGNGLIEYAKGKYGYYLSGSVGSAQSDTTIYHYTDSVSFHPALKKYSSYKSTFGIAGSSLADQKECIAKILNEHPEGIFLRTEYGTHAIVVTDYEIINNVVQLYVVDPVNVRNNHVGRISFENSYTYKNCLLNGAFRENGLDIAYLVKTGTEPVSNYISLCSDNHPTYAKVKLIEDSSVYSLPCSPTTDSASSVVGQLSNNQDVYVTRYLKNTEGHYWLQLENGNWLYAKHVKFVEFINPFSFSDVKLTKTSIAVGGSNGVRGTVNVAGGAGIEYTVTSRYKAAGSTAKDMATVSYSSRSVDLSKEINTQSVFGNLAAGNYTFYVVAKTKNELKCPEGNGTTNWVMQSSGLLSRSSDEFSFSIGTGSNPATYEFDVNGWTDYKENGATGDYATFDVYINGEKVEDDVWDFCSTFSAGTTYEIKDIKPLYGKAYDGLSSYTRDGFVSGGCKGTLNANTDVRLALHTVDSAAFHRIFSPSKVSVFNGHSYYFYDVPATWYGAEIVSEYRGGHLVTITSDAENAFVKNLIGTSDCWIGATDIESEGTWKWCSGEAFSYSNWLSGQPDNNDGNDEDAENYIHISENTSEWNDNAGCVNYPFVCEIDRAYTVTYDSRGGSSIAPQEKAIDQSISLTKSVPLRKEYSFLGWATSASANMVKYAPGAIYSDNADITLYAVWEKTNIASGICGAQGDNLTWTLDSEGALTISGTGNMADYTSDTVPWSDYSDDIKAIDILPGVTSISDWAFDGLTSLTSVSIPASVTSVGEWAFAYCCFESIAVDPENEYFCSDNDILYNKSKTELIRCSCGKSGAFTIPTGVISIGKGAFHSCKSLTSITIPSGVTSIGEDAFSGCYSLESVTIPSGVTSIGSFTFFYCPNLTSVSIPASVTSIGECAFYECYCLKDITIPSGVTSIGDHAFYYCSSLESVIIPSGVTSIADYTFYCCAALENITIPSGVTSIGCNAFEGCSSLTSITIPNSVETIGEYAFSYCSSLASVTIPEGVTSIGDYAFDCCYSLTEISVDPQNAYFSSENGVLYDKPKSKLICCPGGKSGAFTIPTGVTSIGNGAFECCISLTSISIPIGVTSIGADTFCDCDSLESVTIPTSVASIGADAFYGCGKLTDIYYAGTEEQWNALKESIQGGNDAVLNAEIHFVSDSITIDSSTFPDSVFRQYVIDTFADGKNQISKDAIASIEEIDCSSIGIADLTGVEYFTGLKKLVCSGNDLSFLNVTQNTALTWLNFNRNELKEIDLSKNTELRYLAASVNHLASLDLSNNKKLANENVIGAWCTYPFTESIELDAETVQSQKVIDMSAVVGRENIGKIKNVSGGTYNAATGIISTDTATDEISYEYSCGGGAYGHTYILRVTVHLTAQTEVLPEFEVAHPTSANITAPEGGWVIGDNTFSVSAEKACVLAVSYDGGQTYTRLKASANADGSYSFNVNIADENTIIACAYKGDVSGNGSITSADYAMTKAAFLGKIKVSPLNNLCADANGNGSITAADYLMIKAAFLGKIKISW